MLKYFLYLPKKSVEWEENLLYLLGIDIYLLRAINTEIEGDCFLISLSLK